MKILMLTPYLPFPLMSGGQTRSYNLIKYLSEKNDITLFSLIKSDEEKKYVGELKKYCRNVFLFKRSKSPWTVRNILLTVLGFYPFLVIRNLARDERKAIAKELAEGKYDLIHAETFYVMPHLPKTDIPILLVDQTIEYLVYKHFMEEQSKFYLRPILWLDVIKLRYWETYFWRQAKRVVAMSDSDKQQMQKLAKDLSIDIVPNGIDIDFFNRKPNPDSKNPKVLYVGNFKWMQNVEALDVLVNKVWPRIHKKVKNSVLWIVGMNITDKIKSLASDSIKVTEALPDIRDAYSSSNVLVTPIEGPGGTRLKILEAMASALPVVTTSVGAEGLGVANNEQMIISDNYNDMAQKAIDVLQSEKLAKLLGKNARKFVEEKYTWKKSAQLLDKIYKEVINER